MNDLKFNLLSNLYPQLQDKNKHEGFIRTDLGGKSYFFTTSYLSYDENKGWSCQSLNGIQQLKRWLLGSYKETHSQTILNQLKTHPELKYLDCVNRMIRRKGTFDLTNLFPKLKDLQENDLKPLDHRRFALNPRWFVIDTFFGRRFNYLRAVNYLNYDENKGWSVKSLGLIQEIFRSVFGFYKGTHAGTLCSQLLSYPQLEYLDCIKRIRKSNDSSFSIFLDKYLLGCSLDQEANEIKAWGRRKKGDWAVRYLSYDQQKGWSIKYLNVFQISIGRNLLGFYKNTHRSTILNQLKNTKDLALTGLNVANRLQEINFGKPFLCKKATTLTRLQETALVPVSPSYICYDHSCNLLNCLDKYTLKRINKFLNFKEKTNLLFCSKQVFSVLKESYIAAILKNRFCSSLNVIPLSKALGKNTFHLNLNYYFKNPLNKKFTASTPTDIGIKLEKSIFNRFFILNPANLREVLSNCPSITTLDIGLRKEKPNSDQTFNEAEYVEIITAKTPHLKKLSLAHHSSLTDKLFDALIKKLTCLTTLDISSCFSLTDQSLARLSPYSENLEVLILRDNSSFTDEALDQLLAACPKLIKLDISDCSSFTSKTLSSIGKYCKKLKHLNIMNRNMKLDLKDFQQISSPLESLKLIGFCDFNQKQKTQDNNSELISFLSLMYPNLKTLHLEGLIIAESSLETLASCNKLSKLSLIFDYFTRHGIEIKNNRLEKSLIYRLEKSLLFNHAEIVKMIAQKFPFLKSLQVDSRYVNIIQKTELLNLESLANMIHLNFLNLRSYPPTDEQIDCIFTSCKNLTHFCARGSNLTEEGVKKALSKCPKLKSFSLSSFNFTSSLIQYLIENCLNIENLWVEKHFENQEVLKEARLKYPHLRISFVEIC